MSDRQRGKQGVQGIQGFEGVEGHEGEPGPAGPIGEAGPAGALGPAGLNSEAMIERKAKWAFVLFALGALLIASFHTYQLVKLRDYSRDNRAQITRLDKLEKGQRAFRKARVVQTADTDKRICLEVEKVKTQLRLNALKSFAELDQTLRILKVTKTGEIVDIATRNRDLALRRFEAINCRTLPSSKPPG